MKYLHIALYVFLSPKSGVSEMDWVGMQSRAEQMDNSICVSRLLDGVADCSYISGGAVCKAQNQSRPIESEDITVSEDFLSQNILFNIYLRGHDFGTMIFLMNIGITPPLHLDLLTDGFEDC